MFKDNIFLKKKQSVETHFPGLLEATRDWFKIYKVPTGKPANKFAGDGKFYDRAFAVKTIQHDHESWKNLVKGGYDSEPDKKKGISLLNTSLDYSGSQRITSEQGLAAINESSQEFNPTPAFLEQVPIDTVHYIDRSKL